MNTLNLPLALFTVVLRRFIDKLRTPQGAVVLKSAPWLIDTSLLKPCMYAYMFCVGLYYTLKHMQRGTIVSLAKKCSSGAVSIKDNCLRKRWLDRKKSWVVKNFLKNRDGQQKAVRYVASLIPHDRQAQQCPNMNMNMNMNSPLNNNDALTRRCPSGNQRMNQRNMPMFSSQPDNFYASNPYFVPQGPMLSKGQMNQQRGLDTLYCSKTVAQNNAHAKLDSKSNFRKCISDNMCPRQRMLDQSYMGDAYRNFDSDYDRKMRRNHDSSDLLPIDEKSSEYISMSDNTDDYPPKMKMSDVKRKPVPRIRNCLTLRGRKINKNELNCDNKIVRKTRSGRVYGYQMGRTRYKKRNV